MLNEPTANAAPTPPIAAPETPSASAGQPITADAPQARPDGSASALNALPPTSPTPGGGNASPTPRNPNWARRLRPQLPLVGLAMDVPRIAEQRVGVHDLRLEASVKVTSHAGVVVEVPIKTTLSGSMTPAFLPLAQEQFETVVDQLFLTPAKVGFISYLEDVKTERKLEAEKAKQARAAAFEREQEAQRELLNKKGLS